MPPQPSSLSVSLSRHQACRACRTRKIRCDAVRPACGPCIKWAVGRGRDADAVICSYDGDVPNAHQHQHPHPHQEVLTVTSTGMERADSTGTEEQALWEENGKNQVLEGRVAELERLLLHQTAALASLLPGGVHATSGTDASSAAMTSLLGGAGFPSMLLPTAGPSATSSTGSSPEASYPTPPGSTSTSALSIDSHRIRSSSVASTSTSGSSGCFTTGSFSDHRRSIDGGAFTHPQPLFATHLTAPPAELGVESHPPSSASSHSSGSSSVPPAFAVHAPATLTTTVPLGPHSVACTDPNCPEYVRAREAAAAKLSVVSSSYASPPAPPAIPSALAGLLAGSPAAPDASKPAMTNASACLASILGELGFATGMPSSSSESPSTSSAGSSPAMPIESISTPSSVDSGSVEATPHQAHVLPASAGAFAGLEGLYGGSLFGLGAMSQSPSGASVPAGMMSMTPEAWSALFAASSSRAY